MTAIHASARLLAADAPRFLVHATIDPARRALKVPEGIERLHSHQWDFGVEENRARSRVSGEVSRLSVGSLIPTGTA